MRHILLALAITALLLGCADDATEATNQSEATPESDATIAADSAQEGGEESTDDASKPDATGTQDSSETGEDATATEDSAEAEDATEPEEDITEPEEDATEPEEDATEPEDTVEPEEDTTEPEEDVTEPEDTVEPEEDTTEPEELPEVPPVSAECTLEGDYTINNANDLANLADICAITGTLHFESDDNVDLILPDLVEIGGSLDAMNTGSWLSETGIQVLDLPVLTSIGGTLNLISVEYLTTLDLPNLKTVGEDIELWNSHEVTTVTLTSLEQVGGKLLVGEAPEVTSIALPALKEVGGVLNFYEVGYSEEEPLSDKVMTYDFPLLESVGAIRLNTRRVDTLAFPSLKEAKWEIDILGLMKHVSFDSLETVGVEWEEAPAAYNDGVLKVVGYAFYDFDDNAPGTFGEQSEQYDSELETVTLPALVHVEATFAVHPSKSLEAPLLETIGGILLLHESEGFLSEWAPDDPAEPLVLFPSLVSLGSNINIHTDHTLSFPMLKSIGGTLYYDSPMEFPALESALKVYMDEPPAGWEEISLPSLVYTEQLFVRDAEDLVTLSCPQLIGVPPGSDDTFSIDISYSPKLENLVVPNLAPDELRLDIYGSLIQHLSFPETTLATWIELDDLTKLESFSAPKMEASTNLKITDSNALTTLELPLLTSVSNQIKIVGTNLDELHLPALETAKDLELRLSSAETVNFPSLTAVEQKVKVDYSPLLKELLLPSLESVGGTSGVRVESCEALSTLVLDSLTEVSGNLLLGDLPSLGAVSLPALTQMKGLYMEETQASTLSFPSLTTVESSMNVEYNSALQSIEAPVLTSVGTGLSIDTNPKLTSLTLSSLTNVGEMLIIAENPWLPECVVNALVTQLNESQGGAPTLDLNDLRKACTCSEETGPLCFAAYTVENLSGADIILEAVGLDGLPVALSALLIGDYLESTILEVQGLGELRPSAFLGGFKVYGPTVGEDTLLYSGLTDDDWVLQETEDTSKEVYKLVVTN